MQAFLPGELPVKGIRARNSEHLEDGFKTLFGLAWLAVQFPTTLLHGGLDMLSKKEAGELGVSPSPFGDKCLKVVRSEP